VFVLMVMVVMVVVVLVFVAAVLTWRLPDVHRSVAPTVFAAPAGCMLNSKHAAACVLP
jgi:hypothetical protein